MDEATRQWLDRVTELLHNRLVLRIMGRVLTPPNERWFSLEVKEMDQDETVKYRSPPYPKGWSDAIDQIGRGETTSDTAAYVALEYDKLLSKVPHE